MVGSPVPDVDALADAWNPEPPAPAADPGSPADDVAGDPGSGRRRPGDGAGA